MRLPVAASGPSRKLRAQGIFSCATKAIMPKLQVPLAFHKFLKSEIVDVLRGNNFFPVLLAQRFFLPSL